MGGGGGGGDGGHGVWTGWGYGMEVVEPTGGDVLWFFRVCLIIPPNV